jgi:Na+/alanine symporter
MLDKAIVCSCAAFAILGAWAAAGPGGMRLPTAALAVLLVALLVLFLGHMWKHIGGVLMLAFFATGSALEWAYEQTDISFGGFIWGDIRYGDVGVFGVHRGDVPIAVYPGSVLPAGGS